MGFRYAPGKLTTLPKGIPPRTDQALVWHGSAATAIDLNGFITQFKAVNSEATGIDSAGNIVGRASDASGNWYAVMWVPNG